MLISPLTLEIQEETKSGRVRATVRDTVKENYVNAVHVKVIGSRNEDFVSGETDLRGIFVADGINGQSMVIAEADGGRYAFFRGSQELGEPPAPAEHAGQAAAQQSEGEPEVTGKGQLLEGLKGGNRAIQMKNQKALEELYENPVDSGIGGGFGGGIF